MFEPVKIADNVYWVGAVDWNCRSFHGHSYSTHRGTTYNAYLLKGARNVLVDTVYAPFADEMLERISRVIDPSDIDYIVVNHVEPDHSGALPVISQIASRAAVYSTARAVEGISSYYPGISVAETVKTGDVLDFGGRQLTFVEAPMLHWPESMFTYLPDQALLMPNDAFGQHMASGFRFADEVDHGYLMEEAAKYYANILLPYSKLVLKKIAEVQQMNIPIEIIAPSHGLIWRHEPMQIVEAYVRWAAQETEKRVVVAYDTMWQSTEAMALALTEGVESAGVDVRHYKLGVSDHSDVMRDILDAAAVVVGSSTVNNGVLPTVMPLLHEIKGLRPTGRKGLAFGSYGWGGGAVKEIEATLAAAGMDIFEPGLSAKWCPGEDSLTACFDAGKRLGNFLNNG
ncbi:MAG: flavodoxin domain-containing protein [bacterium]|nr:flavodoxin domain-containing protein [bacterium]